MAPNLTGSDLLQYHMTFSASIARFPGIRAGKFGKLCPKNTVMYALLVKLKAFDLRRVLMLYLGSQILSRSWKVYDDVFCTNTNEWLKGLKQERDVNVDDSWLGRSKDAY